MWRQQQQDSKCPARRIESPQLYAVCLSAAVPVGANHRERWKKPQKKCWMWCLWIADKGKTYFFGCRYCIDNRSYTCNLILSFYYCTHTHHTGGGGGVVVISRHDIGPMWGVISSYVLMDGYWEPWSFFVTLIIFRRFDVLVADCNNWQVW